MSKAHRYWTKNAHEHRKKKLFRIESNKYLHMQPSFSTKETYTHTNNDTLEICNVGSRNKFKTKWDFIDWTHSHKHNQLKRFPQGKSPTKHLIRIQCHRNISQKPISSLPKQVDSWTCERVTYSYTQKWKEKKLQLK